MAVVVITPGGRFARRTEVAEQHEEGRTVRAITDDNTPIDLAFAPAGTPLGRCGLRWPRRGGRRRGHHPRHLRCHVDPHRSPAERSRGRAHRNTRLRNALHRQRQRRHHLRDPARPHTPVPPPTSEPSHRASKSFRPPRDRHGQRGLRARPSIAAPIQVRPGRPPMATVHGDVGTPVSAHHTGTSGVRRSTTTSTPAPSCGLIRGAHH